MSFVPLILIFLLMYMFLIRPQQKRVKSQQQLVQSVQSGDEVRLSSGIHGVVNEVEGDLVWLEVAKKRRRPSLHRVRPGRPAGRRAGR